MGHSRAMALIDSVRGRRPRLPGYGRGRQGGQPPTALAISLIVFHTYRGGVGKTIEVVGIMLAIFKCNPDPR